MAQLGAGTVGEKELAAQVLARVQHVRDLGLVGLLLLHDVLLGELPVTAEMLEMVLGLVG